MESSLLSVQDVCSTLNDQATKLDAGAALLREQKRIALMQLKVQSSASGIIPSGPRKRGEGCDEENQGILAAEETSSGGARLRVTLLAAGFVIGPGGSSIRSITHKSGADIRSWNDSITSNGRARRVRTIVIEGNHRSVVLALAILCEAIELYKELCEGKYCGKFVDRSQYIRGVEFIYSPPPRSAVPYAAALKPDSGGSSPDGNGGSAGAGNSPLNSSPSSARYNKHNASPSAASMYLNSVLQQENQSIRAVHTFGGNTNVSSTATGTAGTGSALLFDPGMTDALEAAGLGMSTNSVAPIVTDADVASLQAELTSCAAAAATTTASALAAALAGPSAISLLSQSGNNTTVAPETPSVFHKIFDTGNNNSAAAGGDAIMANTNNSTAAATVAAAPSVQLPSAEFLNMFQIQETSLFDEMNANMSSQQSGMAPPEPVKEIPCYSLFGPDANVFGPNLLRDIWGPDGNGPGLPPIPSWRGMTPVADHQLNAIGLPSYEDFAEKSPYYTSNSNSLRNVLKPGEVPSLRLNNNGFLFSAYEDNSASNTNPVYNNPDYIAAANKRYVYHPTSDHDQIMHDVQQQHQYRN